MAEIDPQTDSVIREIDEELKQERYEKLWKKYGGYVIGAALALVIGVAGFKGWQHWDIQTRTEQSTRYVAAAELIQAKDIQGARDAFAALAEDAGSGYAMLARFQQAGLLVREGAKEEAVAAYRDLADDESLDAAHRDLARVIEGLIAVEGENLDGIEGRLGTLLQGTNPWRHLAKEILAIAAHRRGDATSALAMYKELSEDADAPSGVRARATEMLAVLGA